VAGTTGNSEVKIYRCSRSSIVIIARGKTVRASIPKRSKRIFSSQKLKEAYTASNSKGTGALPWGQSGRVVKLTIHPHLAQKLRITRAAFLFSVCAFMIQKGKILPLSLHVFGNKEKVKFIFAGPNRREV